MGGKISGGGKYLDKNWVESGQDRDRDGHLDLSRSVGMSQGGKKIPILILGRNQDGLPDRSRP